VYLPDFGESENVHNLPEEEWKNTEVITIDIANDPISSRDYKEEFDPSKFKSTKVERGPFGSNWIEELKAKKGTNLAAAYMCAYKLVSYRFVWFGLQERIEKMIQMEARRFFTLFNRQVVCWLDEWYGLTMAEIRQLEVKTKHELDELRSTGSVKGMSVKG